jgi:hypothetical protein
VTRQPATSFPISFQLPFNRAGGRTSNVRQKMARLHTESFVIYGLFDPQTGRCRYIGQTRSPRKREEQHRNPFRGKALNIPNAEFRILREVAADENPSVIENALIREYQTKGEADLNQHTRSFPFKGSSAYYTILWIEKDILFRGFGEVGRAIGSAAQTVKNHFADGDIRIQYDEGITLVLKSWPPYFNPKEAEQDAPSNR